MPTDSPSHRYTFDRARLCLLLILLAGGALRIARLDLMPFEMDEGAACILAGRFSSVNSPFIDDPLMEGYGRLWPLLGVKTSLQFYNTPLFIYFISPAFYFTRDARLAALMFAVFGTLAIWVVYRTGREYFSPPVGLIAAGMMAVSPAAVEYSRRLWGHSLIQIFTPLVFYFALRWVVKERSKAAFWLAFLVLSLQQFHFSGALLWVNLAILFVLFRPKTDWVGVVLGLALASVLGYFPFMIEEIDRGFPSFQIMWEAATRGASDVQRFDRGALDYWFAAPNDLWHSNFWQFRYDNFVGRIPGYRWTQILMGVAWVTALAGCVGWALRDLQNGRFEWRLRAARGARPLILLVWALVPVAAYMLLRVRIVAPYFLVVYPACFLAIAWGTVELWTKVQDKLRPPWLRLVAQTAIVLFFAAWTTHQVAYLVHNRFMLNKLGGGVGSYITYGTQREMIRFIAYDSPGQPVLISQDQLSPKRGIDFRHYYHLWSFDANLQRFFHKDLEGAEYWYVIRNMNYQVRPEFQAFLDQYPFRQFGYMRVYRIARPGPWPEFGV